MSATLPPVDPGVLAKAVDALPGRLRKRLDETVGQVSSWTVTAAETSGVVVVTVDDQTTVTLAAQVRTEADAVCTCLLAPRCLHRTAVLAAAPILASAASPAPVPDQAASPQLTGLAPVPTSTEIPRAQVEAATLLWRAAVPVLESGIPGAGAVVQAQLLRAVHEARGVGLPRAAAAGVRVVEALRAARAERPAFRLADLTDDLGELLSVCHQLTTGVGDVVVARGTARREYEEVGNLRLWGLFAEPVLTTSGYAGAAAHLCDDQGRLWTVSDVRPGGMAEARGAASATISLGEARLSHREVGRSGLVVAGARASTNGRLSTGADVQAVRSAGRPWTEPPLTTLWAASVTDQVARHHDALGLAAPIRPAGGDLAFLRGTLRSGHSGLMLETSEVGPIAVMPTITDPGLPAVANLRQLVRSAAGRDAMLIGRFARTRVVYGLALAADWLPPHLGGHVDLGVDVLQASDLPGRTGEPAISSLVTEPEVPVALQVLRHRVERAVSGGRAAVRTSATADAIRLASAQLPTGSAVVTALQEAAAHRTRDAFGRLDPIDGDRLARAWLAAAVYCAAAHRKLDAVGWLRH